MILSSFISHPSTSIHALAEGNDRHGVTPCVEVIIPQPAHNCFSAPCPYMLKLKGNGFL